MKEKFTEEDLAEVLISFLKVEGWEVYQEVDTVWGRVDIVAKQGPIVWAIECKLSLGFPVLEQAYKALGKFHYVSVAVPWKARSKFAFDIAGRYGIGVILVPKTWRNISEDVKPRLNRRPKRTPELHEEQKDYCKAGTNSGGHWTPFKGTRERLVKMVNLEPGLVFPEAIKRLDHHYSSIASAKSCLKRLIETGVIKELRLENDGGNLRIFPVK